MTAAASNTTPVTGKTEVSVPALSNPLGQTASKAALPKASGGPSAKGTLSAGSESSHKTLELANSSANTGFFSKDPLSLAELDWAFIIIIVVSTMIGISRGMIREFFALVGWIAAALISVAFSEKLGNALPFVGSAGPLTRTILAFVVIVVSTVFVTRLIGKLVQGIFERTTIEAEDRLLGSVFGFVRGCVIVGLIVLFAGSTEYCSSQIWWRDSLMVPTAEKIINWTAPYLPEVLTSWRKS